ncbi:DUF378 domain-containing protein [Candidatus Daviesbacteria bacterium]|nr:DUF378 domain-containing protein [Candidatus Daviesbacteria bacterium]
MVTFLLMAVGAINWGLVGLFGFNLVATVFGSVPSLESLVYVLIGASGVYILATHMNDCKICSAKGKR